MKKHLKLPISLEIIRYPGQTVLKLLFEQTALRDWCLGLCLLKEGLTDGLLVSEERGRKRFELQMVGSSDARAKAQASFGTETTELRITPSDLDYLLHFFLKYYRDGVAEVDHLDLQATSENVEEEESSITFIVPESVPPVNEEEAKKRLGLK